jgi:hypothetical protein
VQRILRPSSITLTTGTYAEALVRWAARSRPRQTIELLTRVHQAAIGIFADGEQYNAGPTGPELSSRLSRTQCPGPGQLCTADPSVWIAGQNRMPAPTSTRWPVCCVNPRPEKQPFAGTTTAHLIAAHLNSLRPRPSATQPDVPRAADAVIATGMAKDPTKPN